MTSDPSLIRIISTLNDFHYFFLVTTTGGTNFVWKSQINAPMKNAELFDYTTAHLNENSCSYALL